MPGHKSARAHAGSYKSLAREPVVCHGDGCASHAETTGQLAGWGQEFARPEPAIQDGPAELTVDLATEILAAGKIDVDLHGLQYIRPRPGNWTGQMRQNWILSWSFAGAKSGSLES